MDPNEDSKPTSRRVHPEPQPDHVDSDFALAMQLQEQDNMESESESEEEDDDESYTNDGYEFFDSLGIDEDLGFLEDTELEMEEDEEEDDDIDPDELSYEELMELGEVIGVERRGASEKEISGSLRAGKWEKESGGIDRCVVCQMEYEQGEQVVALPGCKHPYHWECISKWLHLKNVCPICSHQPI